MEWKKFYSQRYNEEIFLHGKDLSSIGEEKEFIEVIEWYFANGEAIEPLLQRAMDLNAQFSYKVFLAVIEGFKYEDYSISDEVLIKTAQTYLNPKDEAECMEIMQNMEEVLGFTNEFNDWPYTVGELVLNYIKNRKSPISFKFIGKIFPFIKNKEQALKTLLPLADAKAKENSVGEVERFKIQSEELKKSILRSLAEKNAEKEIKDVIINLEMQYGDLGEEFLQCIMDCGRKFSFDFINDIAFRIEEDLAKILVQHNAAPYTHEEIEQLFYLMPDSLDDYVDEEWEREIDEVEEEYWAEQARKDFE
jgi:hypothetical protein